MYVRNSTYIPQLDCSNSRHAPQMKKLPGKSSTGYHTRPCMISLSRGECDVLKIHTRINCCDVGWMGGWINRSRGSPNNKYSGNLSFRYLSYIYLCTYPSKKARFFLLRLILSSKQGLVHDARERASSMYLVSYVFVPKYI